MSHNPQKNVKIYLKEREDHHKLFNTKRRPNSLNFKAKVCTSKSARKKVDACARLVPSFSLGARFLLLTAVLKNRRHKYVNLSSTTRKIYKNMASEGKEESTNTDNEDYRSILPEYGWRVHLSNTYSHTPQACYLPRWTQIPKLVGLGWR